MFMIHSDIFKFELSENNLIDIPVFKRKKVF